MRNEIDAIKQSYRSITLRKENTQVKRSRSADGLDKYPDDQTESNSVTSLTDREEDLCSHIFTSRERVSDLDLLLHEALE